MPFKIKIIQHNVLNWRNRKNELTNTYLNLDPDIIMLQSHGIKTGEPIKIPGYKVIKSNTQEELNDGTAIAIKNKIEHKIIGDYMLNTLAIQISTNTGPIILATDYIPPRRLYLPLPDYYNLFRRNCPVYLFADLNANHPTLGYRQTNTTGRQTYRLIQDRVIQHLGPHFTTFHTARSATTPDIILSNHQIYHNFRTSQGPLNTSDHSIIITELDTQPILIPTPPTPDMKRANWEEFENHIQANTTPSNLEQATLEEIDTEIDTWYNNIQQATNQHIPITRYRTQVGKPPTRETQTLMNRYIRLKQNANIHGWTRQHYITHNELQHTLKETLKREANENWGNTLTQLTHSFREPETFWRKVKSITGETNPTPHYILNQNNEKIVDIKEQETIHRRIWEDILNEEEEEDTDDEEEEHQDRISDFLVFHRQRTIPYHQVNMDRLDENNYLTQPITNSEIKAVIKLTKKTCPGDSGINKTLLSHIPNNSIIQLKNIYNAALSTGYFPDKFKSATIKLIPKHGKDPHNPQNYRPISLLEVPGKIFERIINQRLRIHLETENLHNKYQYGFRNNRGTTQALALITEQIANNKADGKQCHLTLRDISKAFDKVWHRGLQYKILNLNLPILLEKLLCNFLKDRSAKIKLENHLGNIFNISCGVPQGSVLSPTLFIIYTRDSPHSISGLNISYADDITQITHHEGRSKNLMNAKTKQEIERINQYEKKWKIKTNVNKFNIIPIHSKRNEALIINNEATEFTNNGKTLGLKISQTSYISHIKERKGKASHALHKLYKFRHLNTNIKLHLIKALVLPILDYPPIPTHTLSKNQLRILQRVQNKALRFATNERYPYERTTQELHEAHSLLPINIRLHQQAKQIWQKLEDTDPDTVQQIKDRQTHIRKFHTNFPSSLAHLDIEPEPIYT